MKRNLNEIRKDIRKSEHIKIINYIKYFSFSATVTVEPHNQSMK